MKKLNFFKTVPNGMKNLLNMETYIKETNFDPILVELVKIRASQINGCAYCLNMHHIDALKIGETNQRIVLLDAWEETDMFSEKEKLVLELTEKLTLIANYHIDDDLCERLGKYFSNEDFANLVLMISQINTWNRINIACGHDIDKDYK